MRLFLAIELPNNVRDHLVRTQTALKPLLDSATLTRPENLHVTLKFLGEVDDQREAQLCDSLAKITAAPITLTADHLECFPPRGPIRIIAAAMTGDLAILTHVHTAMEQRCHFLGFEKENRKYRPHVTLARAKRPLRPKAREELEAATRNLFPGPTFTVTEIVLVESRLKSTGSEYTVAARFRLAGEGEALAEP